MKWSKKRALVTGGASFISSHLVDALINRKAKVRVADDLSSGKIENIKSHLNSGKIDFIKVDLNKAGVIENLLKNIDIVFHLAACHGGRGYIDLNQAKCTSNIKLDSLVFDACIRKRVEKVVYASSGCVYPNYLQTDPKKILYLKEEMVGPPFDADNMYGWAKFMGEMTLKAYYRDYRMKSVACSYFTVYGERCKEDHAIMAMIARAFIKQDPFIIWGTGEQMRNWTYVSDVVEGTLLAAEKIDDATAINLGTPERVSVIDAAKEILRYTGHKAKMKLLPNMPTGPYNRIADNSLAKKLLGWEPKIKFIVGLHKTIDWYFSAKNRKGVSKNLNRIIIGR